VKKCINVVVLKLSLKQCYKTIFCDYKMTDWMTDADLRFNDWEVDAAENGAVCQSGIK